MKKEAKAQASIITTVLIILGILIAIVVVWNLVMFFVGEQSEEVDAEILIVKSEIKKGSVIVNNVTNLLQIGLSRGADDQDVDFGVIVGDVGGDSRRYLIGSGSPCYPDALETMQCVLNTSGLSEIISITVYPISQEGHIGIPFEQQVRGNEPNNVDPSIEIIEGDGEIPIPTITYCTDIDNDDYCANSSLDGCDNSGCMLGWDDCDDGNASINPDAIEICGDGLDNDCVGGDEPCINHCTDLDNDGYCANSSLDGCDNSGCMLGWDDCDDDDISIWKIWTNIYVDVDGDGYGSGDPFSYCGSNELATKTTEGIGGDCNDQHLIVDPLANTINPGAIEICGDGRDNDCGDGDALCPECTIDADCDNGKFCDGSETCSVGGSCMAGIPPINTFTPDTFTCTNTLCYEPTDAVVNFPDDTKCDDGNVCTMDQCNPAHVDADPITGCSPGFEIIWCLNGDGCCPSGCNSANDNDCNIDYLDPDGDILLVPSYPGCGPGYPDPCFSKVDEGIRVPSSVIEFDNDISWFSGTYEFSLSDTLLSDASKITVWAYEGDDSDFYANLKVGGSELGEKFMTFYNPGASMWKKATWDLGVPITNVELSDMTVSIKGQYGGPPGPSGTAVLESLYVEIERLP